MDEIGSHFRGSIRSYIWQNGFINEIHERSTGIQRYTKEDLSGLRARNERQDLVWRLDALSKWELTPIKVRLDIQAEIHTVLEIASRFDEDLAQWGA